METLHHLLVIFLILLVVELDLATLVRFSHSLSGFPVFGLQLHLVFSVVSVLVLIPDLSVAVELGLIRLAERCTR